MVLGAFAADATAYVPTRISFADLVGSSGGNDRDDVFWTTLREVGLLSITDIPDFDKESMLKDLDDCLHHKKSVGAPDFHLDSNPSGGSRRRTLATRTLAGTPEGILATTASETQTDEDASDLCSNLKASSESFRSAVQKASEAIAARFGAVESAALRDDTRIPIQSLINEGEHLEHFHSYYSDQEASGSRGNAPSTATIDWHTDQGMMLLFTPGQRSDGTIPSGFFIQLKDGSTTEVDFDSKIDDLVIMLGDGVHQYINTESGKSANLRAVPHAVELSDQSLESPRLWYGRMVLPPPEAIHQDSNGKTFGELRNAMIRGDADALSLGCASSSMVARELSGELHEEAGKEDKIVCQEGTAMLCWMRCMNFTDYDTGVDSCASESEHHSLVCANDGGELWKETHSSDYFVRCLSKYEVVGGEFYGMKPDSDNSSAVTRFASGLGVFGTMVVAGAWTFLLA